MQLSGPGIPALASRQACAGFEGAAARHWEDRLVEARANFHQTLGPAMGMVYKITSPSGKGYVGQTKRPLNKRLERHKDLKWGNCKLLKRAIKKYGWANMQVQVLWTGSNEELDAKEIALIRDHGTLAPHGYNALPGGDVNPMSVQCGRDSVKDSWAIPEVRERHIVGRKQAWADPTKRANIMAGRAASEKVAKAKREAKQNGEEANAKRTATWEAKREARLEGLTGKAREQRLARMNRDREKQRAKAAEKRRTSC